MSARGRRAQARRASTTKWQEIQGWWGSPAFLFAQNRIEYGRGLIEEASAADSNYMDITDITRR